MELLYPHARLLAPILRSFKPDFLSEDLKFIRFLGESEGFQEAQDCVADFRGTTRASRNILWRWCRIRVSGRKAGKLARRLCHPECNRPFC
jgi:hypothetical protein